LVEGEESLLILSGVNGGERLREAGVKPDNVVFLKAYRNIKGIAAALEESDMLTGSVGVSNCALPNEAIEPDINELVDRPPNYWTLIIAKQKKPHASPKR
jgi:precorrin-2/cobalt-factor-2 C20-methyltransferase